MRLPLREFTSKWLPLLSVVVWTAGLAQADLTHRWSFEGDATDSVGSLDWAVSGGANISGGAVSFDGVDDFLELTTTPLPTSGSTTIEVWGTYDPSTPFGSRIFDFSSANGDLFYYLSPNLQNSTTMINTTGAGWDDTFNFEVGPRATGPSNSGEEVLLTLVYDAAATPDTLGPGEWRLYRNGSLVAARGSEGLNILGFEGAGTTTVNRLGHGISDTTNANLGTPELDNPPAFLNGSINEFRTHDNPLSADDVLINYIAGPNNPNPTFTDTTWNVAGTGDWNAGGNWSGTSVPGDGTRAVISNGGTASVTSAAVPQAGRLAILDGTLEVSGNGLLDVRYPIDMLPGTADSSAIAISSGGQLVVSRVNGDDLGRPKTISLDGGTLSSNFAQGSVAASVSVDVGEGGATFSSGAGQRLSIAGLLTGTGPITIEGGGKSGFTGGGENTYSGEVAVNNSTLDLSNLDGLAGGFQSLNSASRIVLNNSTIDSIPSGGGGNIMLAPIHAAEGTVNTINHLGSNATAEREPFFQGDLTGSGELHFDSTRTAPVGIDFGAITAVDPEGCVPGVDDPCTVLDETDNSGFTGRIILADVTQNDPGMQLAVRIRSDGGDFPNAIVDIRGSGSRLGKRATDTNQTIQLGGIAGVAGSYLTPNGGLGGADTDEPGDVTFELGGAAEDAEFFGYIEDSGSGNHVATVVKVGSNTQALSGPNTYSGPTTVDGGTLLVNGTHMMADNPVGDYTVNAGGTLGGTGVIGSSGDNVNVNVVGGTLAPGDGAGTLTVNGNYAQDAASILAVEIAGTPASGSFDVLDVSGSATLAGMVDVSILGSPSLTVGDEFTVLSASSILGGGSLSLTGAAASAFSLDVASGNSLVLTYLGGGIVDVDLDNDGDVDGRDFLLIQMTDPSLISAWQAQYGSDAPEALISSIPEPTSGGLLLLTLLLSSGVGTRWAKSERSLS